MTGVLCKREDCKVERDMRAMEDYRAKQAAPGGKPLWADSATWQYCAQCQRLKGWKRSKEGLVHSLTTS